MLQHKTYHQIPLKCIGRSMNHPNYWYGGRRVRVVLIILSGLKLVNLVNRNSLIWWKQKMGTSTNTRSPLSIQTSSLSSCFWPNVKRPIKQWSSCFWPMDHSWIYTKPIYAQSKMKPSKLCTKMLPRVLDFWPLYPYRIYFLWPSLKHCRSLRILED